jgi:FeS assembly SUF system protein
LIESELKTEPESRIILMVDSRKIKEKLRECYDPEIPINIVDLGLVYDIEIKGDGVLVRMTLTAPGCPLAGSIVEDVRRKLLELEGVRSAEVELVWDPPWTPERISEEAKDTLGF